MAKPNFVNRTIYHADNLSVLKGMNSESVHLIATDPPFNKNRDFHATPDSLARGAKFQDRWSWDRDVHDEWMDEMREDWESVWWVIEAARKAYGDDMGAFLCWLGVRLMEMHRVLRDDGSIYLHMDHTAHAYVKGVMDGVFGKDNFRNDIIWKRSTRSDGRRYGRTHDTIFFYTKSDDFTWHDVYTKLDAEYVERFYREADERGDYSRADLTGPGISAGESGKPWRGIDPGTSGRCWSVPRTGRYAAWIERRHIPGYRDIQSPLKRLDLLEKHGFIHWPKRGKGWPRLKRYKIASNQQPINDVFDDIRPVSNLSGEDSGYPTQKPLALYERIIRASSNRGDMVLDPFAGCATTPVAAERLGRQWVGIDIWQGAHRLVLERLGNEFLSVPEVSSGRLFNLGAVTYTKEPPERKDDRVEAAPGLELREPERVPKYQQLSHDRMKSYLADAQRNWRGRIICAGCGRGYDIRMMHLDHKQPRSKGGADYITNRVLLCGYCNGRKGNRLTLSELRRRNNDDGWMDSERRAVESGRRAEEMARDVRDEIGR